MSDQTYPPQDQKPYGDPPPPPVDPTPPASQCEPLPPGPETPKLPPLTPCDQPCCCPQKPGSNGTCLDGLIDEQTKQIIEADRAKAFKADLEDLVKKAKLAKADYTNEKYKDLRDRWEKLDAAIADLIAKLVCAIPCWWCLIECEVCTLLYAIRDAELRLNGDGTLIDKVYSLRDLQYWQTRNRDAKREVFDRIKGVLTAWENPAKAIDKILSDNAKLVDDTKKILATDSGLAVYDVFMRLVPMHLAIAPRGVVSKIGPDYTKFCSCDTGTPDDCCGPDVGRQSLRQRLLGPQPYLVEPDKFFDIICCLAKERYLPAKDQLATAESDLAKTESDIKRAISDIDTKKASVAADYKAHIVNPIDCDKYKRIGGKANPNTPCNPAPSSPYQAR